MSDLMRFLQAIDAIAIDDGGDVRYEGVSRSLYGIGSGVKPRKPCDKRVGAL